MSTRGASVKEHYSGTLARDYAMETRFELSLALLLLIILMRYRWERLPNGHYAVGAQI